MTDLIERCLVLILLGISDIFVYDLMIFHKRIAANERLFSSGCDLFARYHQSPFLREG